MDLNKTSACQISVIKPPYYIQYLPPVSLSGFVGCDSVGRLWIIACWHCCLYILRGDIIMEKKKKKHHLRSHICYKACESFIWYLTTGGRMEIHWDVANWNRNLVVYLDPKDQSSFYHHQTYVVAALNIKYIATVWQIWSILHTCRKLWKSCGNIPALEGPSKNNMELKKDKVQGNKPNLFLFMRVVFPGCCSRLLFVQSDTRRFKPAHVFALI